MTADWAKILRWEKALPSPALKLFTKYLQIEQDFKSSLVTLITADYVNPICHPEKENLLAMASVGIKYLPLCTKWDCILQPSPILFQNQLHFTVTILLKDKYTTILGWLWEHTIPQLLFIWMLKPLWVSGHQEFDIWSDNTVTDWIEPFYVTKHRRRCSLLHYPLYVSYLHCKIVIWKFKYT